MIETLKQRAPTDVSSAARPYQPFGAALELFYSHDDEFMLDGPAGTGKSVACLNKIHFCAMKYPGMRALLVRKTRASLTQTGLVSFEQNVLPQNSTIRLWKAVQEYKYPNRSVVAVAGLDNPTKIMSAEYDMIYVQEATEATEHDWEYLITRLRNGKMPYQQIIGDCNPDAPSHWLKKREMRGAVKMRASKHTDNPTLYNQTTNEWTTRGQSYIGKLEKLSGVRRDRLLKGLWVMAEGMIYDGWDRSHHLVDRFEIPKEWTRYWTVDFGFTNPFVWQAWAENPDGDLFRYREIYHTARLVEDHAKQILEITKDEPRPRFVVCDHDAEDRATLERYLSLYTTAAVKDVSPGIQQVATRLRKNEVTGRARIFFMRDALVERDAALDENKKPASTEEEIEGYVWDTAQNRKKGEQPVKRDDHGLDATRYLVMEVERENYRGQVQHGDAGIW